MHTGEIIKYLRKEKELTQEQLAILLGVRKSSVQKYENGKIQNLKLDTLQKLCKTFRTSPYAFVFPDTWEKIHIQHKGGGNLTHQAMILYLKVSD